MSGDHNMYQKSKSYLDDFECPRCGHCCQALVDETAKRKHIKTWHERCEEHPDHQQGMISERMIQERMQEEIDELRQALETEQEPVAWISDSPTKGNGKQLHWTKSEAWRWSSNIAPLYTAPIKREWVGLTLNEAEDFYEKYTDRAELINAIDKFLEEKNT